MKKKFNPDYNDRGSMKWMGMYLSEHSASMEAEQKSAAKIIPKKVQMNPLDIAAVLEQAILKQLPVSIQLKEVNQNGQFSEDITGYLAGTDETGLWVNQTCVAFDDIRNIQLNHPKKWSALS